MIYAQFNINQQHFSSIMPIASEAYSPVYLHGSGNLREDGGHHPRPGIASGRR